MMKNTRRDFLRNSLLASAAVTMTAKSYARVQGANERIGIGLIGCGGRGKGAHLMGVRPHAEKTNVEFVALAEPWRIPREETAELAKSHYNRDIAQYASYRDLLEHPEVDAVMIASPDHLHTLHLEATAKAGKHVYCEKPLAMNFEKLKQACDAVREAGIVFQAGTQLRSYATFTGCRALVQEGRLGTLSRIEQVRNDARPYWYRFVKDAQAEDVDWAEFLNDRPDRPFDPLLFTGWYGFREFSDGPLPGFGSHYIDLVHYLTGASMPVSASASGGIYTWKDEYGFTCHDQVQATWEYAEGFMVSYSTNFGNGSGSSFRALGNEGVLDMTDWGSPKFLNAGVATEGRLDRVEEDVASIERPDHILDWLQCLRSGAECNANLDAGYSHAVACLMAMRATDTGRRHIYDPETREIKEG